MQLAPGKLALCFRLFYIFEREPEPPSKKKKMPQRVLVILSLSPNPRLPRKDQASGVLSEKEPGGSCENGPKPGEKKTQ